MPAKRKAAFCHRRGGAYAKGEDVPILGELFCEGIAGRARREALRRKECREYSQCVRHGPCTLGKVAVSEGAAVSFRYRV